MTGSGAGETVPCETCGTPTHMTGTKRCDDCWEVERRLGEYLRRGGANAREEKARR